MSYEPPRRTPASLREYEGDRQFATTLARGLELLRCFSPERPVLGNKELAQLMQLPPATITRLTYTLRCMGYLTSADQHGKHQLGAAVLSLGLPLLTQFPSRRRARPLMLELAHAVGGAVMLGVRDRLTIVYLEAIRSYNKRIYPLDIGTRHSLVGTAIGRAYLMACTAPERESLLNELRVKDPDAWRHHGAQVLDNLERYPQHGCCVSVGEIFPDVQAVAVPLGRIDRGEPAALSCTFQGRPLDARWLREVVAPQLQVVARKLI